MSVRGRWVLPVVALVVLALVVMASVHIWTGRSDAQGEANISCIKNDLPPVPNLTSGIVASGHNTVCGDFGGNSAIYVYVHRVGEEDGRGNLVLRYSEEANWDLPQIKWQSAHILFIRVAHVVQITKQVRDIAGVNIEYEIEKQDYPALNSAKSP